MALTKVTGKGITCSAVTEDKLGTSAVTTNKIGPDAVTSAKIQDGQVTADDLASTLDLSSKTLTLPSDVVADAKRPVQDNIALLGFKMAVNDGLTVFNLVDGVVDEFNDESGTDEAEGSNDYYCGTTDFYTNNQTCISVSAGFAVASVTEPDTSTAGSNPATGSICLATYTVPTGVTNVTAFLWGAGGGGGGRGGDSPVLAGGGGGFTTGCLAVSPGQVIKVSAGEGGGVNPVPDACTYMTNEGGGGIGYGGGTGVHGAGGGGGGAAGLALPGVSSESGPYSTPQFYMIAGAGGGSGYGNPQASGGAGGGLTGDAGGSGVAEQALANQGAGGGGDQEQGGQGGSGPGGTAQSGSFVAGGNAILNPMAGDNSGGGGEGFYGGGGGSNNSTNGRKGGGGSSYFGHPQVSCGSTEEGLTGYVNPASSPEGGGVGNPNYVAGTNEGGVGGQSSTQAGEDGYVLLTGCGTSLAQPGGGSTTIISTAFTSTSVATSARIVVFEENVDTPTLNTDIIASVSRDGTNFTNATLTDSGYVTGSSGQRILTGQADISGQPSGQSMRWKLALANNTVKIHGVALQWS